MMRFRITYRLDQSPSHATLTVWINGACAGGLTTRVDEIGVLHTLIETLELNKATRVP